jgi:hypothetical protein
MPTHDEYRKLADEYYSLATEAKTETDRLALLDIAPGRQVSRADRRAGRSGADPETEVQDAGPSNALGMAPAIAVAPVALT